MLALSYPLALRSDNGIDTLFAADERAKSKKDLVLLYATEVQMVTPEVTGP